MDPLYEALILYKNRKFDKCIDKCTQILKDSPLDQTVWVLKMRAMTRKVRNENPDEEDANWEQTGSIWNEVIATAPRPGTSLRNPVQATSILRRPATTANHTTAKSTTAGRLRTSHTPSTARSRLATAQARAMRLGTATMMSNQDNTFIDVSKLNLTKYSQDRCISKPLFEFLFYHEGEYRRAMELAVQATKNVNFSDWWWKLALANCYSAFNLIRDAEQQLRSATKQHLHMDCYLKMAKNFARLDQPTTALDVCREGLEYFPNDVKLMTEQARLLEGIGDAVESVKVYRSIATQDAMNIEAISNIAVFHFYNDQPEMALRYYRRILAMGTYTSELFNNVALCCLRAQHWDITLACYRRALLLAVKLPIQAEVWYNLSHLALAIGDINLSIQCLRLCINLDPSHASALNNLAGLEMEQGHMSVSRSLFSAALSADPNLIEAQTNIKNIDDLNFQLYSKT